MDEMQRSFEAASLFETTLNLKQYWTRFNNQLHYAALVKWNLWSLVAGSQALGGHWTWVGPSPETR